MARGPDRNRADSRQSVLVCRYRAAGGSSLQWTDQPVFRLWRTSGGQYRHNGDGMAGTIGTASRGGGMAASSAAVSAACLAEPKYENCVRPGRPAVWYAHHDHRRAELGTGGNSPVPGTAIALEGRTLGRRRHGRFAELLCDGGDAAGAGGLRRHHDGPGRAGGRGEQSGHLCHSASGSGCRDKERPAAGGLHLLFNLWAAGLLAAFWQLGLGRWLAELQATSIRIALFHTLFNLLPALLLLAGQSTVAFFRAGQYDRGNFHPRQKENAI